MHGHRIGAIAAVAVTLFSGVARAVDWSDIFQFSGYASSDLRFEIEDYRGGQGGGGYQFQVNYNDVDLRLTIKPHPKVVAVIDARFRYYGFASSQTLAVADLWDNSKVDPFTVYLDQAYVAVHGVPWSWMDLKAGRMQQTWGSVDVFSPNDNLNSRDFSDPLVFTRKVPNEMVEIDAYPNDWLSINAVWVPIFQPSMLPPSAPLAFQIQDNAQGCLSQFPGPPLSKAGLSKLESLFSTVNPCTLNFAPPQVTTYLPSNTIADSQVGVRARVKVGDLDMGFNYYYGRFGFPVAYDASVAVSAPSGGRTNVAYGAEVTYPRMQVVGFDFNYSAPWLFGVGFVGDVAVIFPQQVNFALGLYSSGTLLDPLFTQVNVPTTPFVKASVGAEETFTEWFYLNVLFIHGFVDEFNDAYGLHNYLSVTPEFKILRDTLKLRLASIVDLTDDSYVLYPQLTWVVLPSVETTLGAFWLGGPIVPPSSSGGESIEIIDYAARSKFGQPAAGRSVAFLKVKVTW